jgi:prepilin-type processing-associated H-X9-DG protein
MYNLHQLGIAMNLYREAYARFPSKLSALYPKYVSDLNLFSCPGSPRKIHGREDIDSLSGYVLFTVAVPIDATNTDSSWMDEPLLTDRRRNHLGKMDGVWGGNILYADGHVEWMPDVHPTEPYTSDIVTTNFSFKFPD